MSRVKDITLAVLLLGVIFLGYLYFNKENKQPEIVTVPQVTTQEVQKAAPEMSRHEAERTTRIIERTVEKSVPAQTWYSSSEPLADAKAQKVAKEDEADKVIKHVEEKPVEGSGQKVVEADYYGIHLERKHRIKMGAAVIDDEVYGSLSYQNRDLEYTVFASQSGKYGGGIQYTIARW